jgi:predicted esterase
MNAIPMSREELARDPHARQPVLHAGAPLDAARAVVIMLHGRGADAHDILGLAGAMAVPEVAWLAPDAAAHHWYPDRFMQPIANNEPWLSSAVAFVDRTVQQVLAAGIPAERLVLGGFSQGACLALEYAARHARRYGGLVAFAGGLIGPDDTPRDYAGTFAGTPVFIGVGDQDPHIPVARSTESAEVLTRMEAAVDLRVYAGLSHTVIEDEVRAGQAIIALAAGGAPTRP